MSWPTPIWRATAKPTVPAAQTKTLRYISDGSPAKRRANGGQGFCFFRRSAPEKYALPGGMEGGRRHGHTHFEAIPTEATRSAA